MDQAYPIGNFLDFVDLCSCWKQWSYCCLWWVVESMNHQNQPCDMVKEKEMKKKKMNK